MVKVQFIYFDLRSGHYQSFHHGLAYIIGTLKSEKHEVVLSHITDESEFTNVEEQIKKWKPDIIGLSFTSNQKKYAIRFMNTIKPSAKLVIAGGVECTLAQEKIFKDIPDIDGICIGEGEVPVKELCWRLDNNKDILSTHSFYFKKDAEIIKNPILPLQDIDVLPFPDYSLFNYKQIINDRGNCVSMMLSRGCSYDCHYCCNAAIGNVYPNKNHYVRFPSINRSMDIVKNNLSLFPYAKKIIFSDDTFTLNAPWLIAFCERYKKEIDLPFLCNARVETVNEEILKALHCAGCVSIEFGIETGSEWLRSHVLNRHHSNERIKEVFDMTKRYGIKRFSYNMIGLPFETKEMARETFELNLKLRPNFGKCFYFYPYPGTELYKICLDNDLLGDGLELMSGYLEAPSLKEKAISHRETRKYFELINIYFYTRLLFSKISIPDTLEMMLLKVSFIFRKQLLFILDPITQCSIIRVFRNMMRKLAYNYLR
ncbi:MAG: B12-binding domain-containing radical SAM protein [Candidatus Omnitrophica bacterium]|nr:B12-binding domain-containing radical SAM protein [Candidatus Omnitrophota bacterium]